MYENRLMSEGAVLAENQLRLEEAEGQRRMEARLREVRAPDILRKDVLKALRAGLRLEQVGEVASHALRAAEGR